MGLAMSHPGFARFARHVVTVGPARRAETSRRTAECGTVEIEKLGGLGTALGARPASADQFKYLEVHLSQK